MARVFDARATYVRPNLVNLRWCPPLMDSGVLNICGDVRLEVDVPNRAMPYNPYTTKPKTLDSWSSFRCPTLDSLAWQLCKIEPNSSGLVPFSSHFYNQNLSSYDVTSHGTISGAASLVWTLSETVQDLPTDSNKTITI